MTALSRDPAVSPVPRTSRALQVLINVAQGPYQVLRVAAPSKFGRVERSRAFRPGRAYFSDFPDCTGKPAFTGWEERLATLW